MDFDALQKPGKIVDGNRTTLFEIVFHKGRFGLRKFKA